MRALLTVLLVLSASLAGCADRGAGVDLATLEMGRVTGVLMTPSLEPIVGARVHVPDSPHAAVTDAAGAFVLRLPLGEWLVLTDAPGFVNVAQRARLDGQDVHLTFTLSAKPTEAPTRRTQEFQGFVTCAATVTTGDGHGQGSEQAQNCGSRDPNNRMAIDFGLDVEPGITGIVIEMKWNPVSVASKVFHLEIVQVHPDGTEEGVGGNEGDGYISIVIPPSVAEFRFRDGGSLRAHAMPAGSLFDEESPANAGFAFQQPFTIYVTVFANAPPPSGWSVLG